MILDRLFRPRAAQEAGRALYAAAVAEARQPRFYAELGAPDTPEGRFELYTLHVLLLIERLRGQGQPAAEASQALFDTYLSALDHGLRELGVGDTSVGKKMRRLGEAFYGRGKSYDAALAALPDEAPLAAFLARTAFEGAAGGRPEALAQDLLAKRTALAAQPLQDLLSGRITWEMRA